MKNPYAPNLNIDGYMRYLKYNTPSAQPEIVRCKNCKYNPDNPRPFYDDDPVETYAWCKTEYFDEQGFCSRGKLAITLQ